MKRLRQILVAGQTRWALEEGAGEILCHPFALFRAHLPHVIQVVLVTYDDERDVTGFFDVVDVVLDVDNVFEAFPVGDAVD